jgi:hypothetical protein
MTQDFVEPLVAGWKHGRIPRTTGSEKRFYDAREVAFRVTLFDKVIVDSVAERGRVEARVDEIDRVTARDKKIDERGIAAPRSVMQGRVSVAGFCLRDRKSEVEHETDRFIVEIGLPAIAGQKFEIDTRQRCNDPGMLPNDGLGFQTTAKDATDEQAGLRIALFVKQIK